jgi:hypothetical protein
MAFQTALDLFAPLDLARFHCAYARVLSLRAIAGNRNRANSSYMSHLSGILADT